MTGTSKETRIVDVTIRNAELANQSELISLLMQRIADMQEELQQTKDLAKLVIASNEPPPPFPSISSPLPNYFPTHTTGPITSTPNPHTIDLTVSNWKGWEDCVVISAECTTTPIIRDAGPGEMLQNWMATPLMIHRMACKNESKPANVLTCHEHGKPSKIDEDECEEYDEETMMPEHLPRT
uniref:Uncharacterized protein n=1 Tax=Solanum tuberosum TaxID=4113 RepID=M1DK85_SOLTU